MIGNMSKERSVETVVMKEQVVNITMAKLKIEVTQEDIDMAIEHNLKMPWGWDISPIGVALKRMGYSNSHAGWRTISLDNTHVAMPRIAKDFTIKFAQCFRGKTTQTNRKIVQYFSSRTGSGRSVPKTNKDIRLEPFSFEVEINE